MVTQDMENVHYGINKPKVKILKTNNNNYIQRSKA